MPKVIFDTSGINALEKTGLSGSDPVMTRLNRDFEVILTSMNEGELIATHDPAVRGPLLAVFIRLLQSAPCLCPHFEIVRLLVSAHAGSGSPFSWTNVDVTAGEYRDAIISRDFDEDELSAAQRAQQRATKRLFKESSRSVRKALLIDESKRPSTYANAAALEDGAVLRVFARALYHDCSGRELTAAEIQSFMDACPPFRAASHGRFMDFYNEALRPLDGSTGRAAGINDLMAAAYLPYCNWFVTADEPQERSLLEVASEAKLECEILSFNEFDRRLRS